MMSGDDDPERSPTATRRALAQRLRQLRIEAGLTGDQASERVGFSDSKITKIERAQAVASREDVIKMIDAYGSVIDGGVADDERERLLAMARQGNRKEWWEQHDRQLPPKLGSYLGLEAVATSLRAYDTTLVHGLFQTAEYARAVIRGGRPDLLDDEVELLVETRKRRQEILVRKDQPLELWSIMDEAVLRRKIGGREVMHAQLERLIKATEMPNVTLLVMPDDMGVHAGLAGPLSILQFEAGTRPVVYVDDQAGNLYLERGEDLRRCQSIMNHVLASAPSPDQSLALIQQISEEMKP
jgi:transcriptional regulator with XRE-family HTH domain